MPAPPPHVRLLSMPDLPTTPLFEDSQCCIDVARGGGSFKKLRHIPVAESYIYHCIAIEPSLRGGVLEGQPSLLI